MSNVALLIHAQQQCHIHIYIAPQIHGPRGPNRSLYSLPGCHWLHAASGEAALCWSYWQLESPAVHTATRGIWRHMSLSATCLSWGPTAPTHMLWSSLKSPGLPRITKCKSRGCNTGTFCWKSAPRLRACLAQQRNDIAVLRCTVYNEHMLYCTLTLVVLFKWREKRIVAWRPFEYSCTKKNALVFWLYVRQGIAGTFFLGECWLTKQWGSKRNSCYHFTFQWRN